MSVYKRGDSPHFHYDFQYKGHRFYGSTGAGTRAKALKVEVARREQAALDHARNLSPTRRKSTVPTLDEAAAEWWEFKGKALGRPEDEKARETRLENAILLVGPEKLVTELRTADIAEAIRRRRGKLVRDKTVPSNATVNRDVIEVVRRVIRRACKLLEVSPPPIDWAELRLPEPKPKPRSFAADDLERLILELPLYVQDMARFAARYGCRLEELFFSLSDIDIEAQRVVLADRKGGDDHTLPLVGDDAAMLAARKGRAEAAGLDTVWFRQLKSGKLKPLTRRGVLQTFRRAMRSTGLHASQGAKGSHDLRRHAAIEMLRATGNLRAAQRLLGHADIKSTLVYADVDEADIRAGLESVLSRAIGHKGGPSVHEPEAATMVEIATEL